jgi:PAS domain S-box-containing protein
MAISEPSDVKPEVGGRPKRRALAAWLVLACALFATGIAWRESYNDAEMRLKTEFEVLTIEVLAKLDARLATYTQILRSASGLFLASSDVTREEWAAYVAHLELERNFPALPALAFARMIKDAELNAFIEEMRASGVADFSIRPPGQRSEYVVNAYTEPYAGLNVKALGYDMWQDEDRRTTMEMARDSGQPKITQRITLRIDEAVNPVPAFIMYMPVYLRGQTQVYGYVLSPFRMPTLMSDLLGRNEAYLSLAVYDGSAPSPDNLFYRSPGDQGGASPRFTARRILDVGGRSWTLDFSSRQALDGKGYGYRSSLILVFGALLSMLLFGVVWSLIRTKERAERIADEQTASLRESETKFRELFDQAPMGIWLIDHRGCVLDCNAKFAEYTGSSRGRIIGFDMIGEAKDGVLSEPILRAISGQTVSLELPYTSTTGNKSSIYHYIFKPVYIDGAFAYVLGFAEDIKARKEAEEALRQSEGRFREMAESIDQVFFVADYDYSKFHYISPAFERIWGHPVNQLIDNPSSWISMLHPEDRDRTISFVARHIDSEDYAAEFRIIRTDGEVRHIFAHAYNLPEREGRPGHVVGFHADVTDRKLAEAALEARTKELERSNAELEQFAYIASHDLREPLRMVSSFVTLLERRYGDRLDKEGLEFIAFAKDGAERMNRLVLDLLDFSRIGRKSPPVKHVPLKDAVALAAAYLQAKLEESHASLNIADDLPVLRASEQELARLMQNLIDNAIKYRAPDKTPEITISAKREGDMWVISVADNGIGIAPEHFNRIFGIFQRLHTRDKYEGTGIGLAICKKIVEHWGGRIWVDSRLGEGTTFSFALPA